MIVTFVNAGIIPIEQSAENALTTWANDNERKLSGMGLGQMLDSFRHRAWARAKMRTAAIGSAKLPNGFLLRWVEA